MRCCPGKEHFRCGRKEHLRCCRMEHFWCCIHYKVVHDRGDHWIAIASSMDLQDGQLCCEVNIHHSVYTNIHNATLSLLFKLFRSEARIKLTDCQRQEGGQDCGQFTTAMCTVLAHNLSPQHFSQNGTRAHLLKSFEELHLTPFP